MAEDEFMEWKNNANEQDILENMRKVVLGSFRAREINWSKFRGPKKFSHVVPR